MNIRITKAAIKELAKVAKPQQVRIRAKIAQYAADPLALANQVKRLTGRSEYRLRVGDYRVLFVIEEDGTVTVMVVTGIKHRREAYD